MEKKGGGGKKRGIKKMKDKEEKDEEEETGWQRDEDKRCQEEKKEKEGGGKEAEGEEPMIKSGFALVHKDLKVLDGFYNERCSAKRHKAKKSFKGAVNPK